MKKFVFLAFSSLFSFVPISFAEIVTGGTPAGSGSIPSFLEYQLEKTGSSEPSRNAYSFRKVNFGKGDVNFSYIKEKNKKLIREEVRPEEPVIASVRKISIDRFPRRNSTVRKSFSNVREFALDLNIRQTTSEMRKDSLSVRGRSEGQRKINEKEEIENPTVYDQSLKNFQGTRINQQRKSYSSYSALKLKRDELQLGGDYVRFDEDSWQRSSRIWNKMKKEK